MEDDNEILDWGNEDDEHNETLRKPPFNNDQRNIAELDAEDSISLGDEDEDNPEYLSYRREGTNGHSANAGDTAESHLRSQTPQRNLTTGAKQESQQFSGETTHEKSSTPHKTGSTDDSPRRKHHSRDQSSPQSQPNPGRLTHALPPKPVATKVPPYLPPSHPSIVEATSMIISPRAGGRETKKSNGVSSGASIPSTTDELPHNWECREARNGAGKYYYNKETHQSTWEKPVSSIPSASSHTESRSRRRRSISTGRRHRTPPDSNPPQSQTTRPSRNSTHMPSDREMDDTTKTVPNGLSHKDRHYRPDRETPPLFVEIRTTERLSEVVNNRVSSQSRYDRIPQASLPPSRRRARSSSPPRESRASYLHEKEKEYQSSRGNSHSARAQNAYTNDSRRDFEALQPNSGYTEYYEPIGREYRAPPEDDPRSTASSSRKDRSLRPDRQAPVGNLVPEVSLNRPRDRDLVPASTYTHPSRRVSEREYDRNRREQQILERDELPRRPVDYPPPANQIAPEQSKRHYDHEPSRPRPSDFDRSSPDHGGHSSHRKRVSLPPQARTFLASSTAPAYARDAPSHYYAAPVAPRSLRLPDFRGPEGGSDRQASISPAVNLVTVGSDIPINRSRDHDLAPSPIFTHPSRRVNEQDYDRNRREQQILERDELPRRPVDYLPPTNQISEQSKQHYNREPSKPYPSDLDRSSPDHVGQSSHRKRAPLPSQTRTFLTSSTAGVFRDAPSHSSVRIPDFSGPDGGVPLAPRSMIEEPLRSGGNAEYDRDIGRNSTRHLDTSDIPQIRTTHDLSIDNNSRQSESSEAQSALPPTAPVPGKARQRKSRFDKPLAQLEPRSTVQEPFPLLDRDTKSDAGDKRTATPPPLSPEPSVVSSMEHILPPPSEPPSLSHRLSDAKPRHPHGPVSTRDENSREVGISFQNVHAELAREPEEGMIFPDRLERPQVQRRSTSLLDRLSTGNPQSQDSRATQQSLRDRIIPSKRDREDMIMDEGMRDVSFDGEDGSESKRARRRNGRARTRGGRRGAP